MVKNRSVDNKLILWLDNELKTRGWSHRELARRAELSQTAISTVLSGQRQPGWDFCVRVATALGETPDQVFRLAGLLPPLPAPEDDATLRDLIAYAKQLSHEERQLVLDFTRWRYHQKQEESGQVESPQAARESSAHP